MMSDYVLLIPELSFIFAAETETVAEDASCTNFRQRRRIKLDSQSSSPSSQTISVDEAREESARERGALLSVDVGETGIKKNGRPFVLISAKSVAVAPSQGQLL